MNLDALLDVDALGRRIRDGYVREQTHPTLPLRILNYTEKCAYDRAWDDVTRLCRGLIYDGETLEVVARPFPKFFNHGEPLAPVLDLAAPAFVTDKLDGSLGILYPMGVDGRDRYAVATRGSFASEQAFHATQVWRENYAPYFKPAQFVTYLFEIVYPGNRIVCDYGDLDDLILLAALDVRTGCQLLDPRWPGLRAETFRYQTLADALAAEPRPNSEGLVVYLPETGERVKIKQDDYVALHRILTGTNARNVWEVAAVQACAPFVTDRKHWGSYLRIDPARAEQILELGDDWLAGVPDEFYAWIEETTADAETDARRELERGLLLAAEAAKIAERRTRYEYVAASGHPATQEIMRLAEGRDEERARLEMRCWLMAQPEPTSPFARGEAIA